MTAHFDLVEYALGTLPVEERARADEHVASCAACVDELRVICELLGDLGLALAPEAPSANLLERLMASTQSRFASMIDRVAKLFDVAAEQARAWLDGLDSAAWEDSGIPGVQLLHVDGGPAIGAADAGFVRFAPNLPFPYHSHVGDEVMLILEGSVVENDGHEGHVGDAMCKAGGTAHSFTVGPEGCLVALLLVGGINIDGVTYGQRK